MKKINYILGTIVAAAAMTSCVGDLNVTPIDPNANTVDKVLTSQQALDSYISGVYLGFATSGYYGPNGDPSISGLDGGASQYIRGLYHHSELTTDESVCGWNDQTIKNFHYMNWTNDDTFIYAFYSRIFMQVAAANEFLREVRHLDNMDAATVNRYADEARVLRAIAYFHAIDNFGNVPFADETTVVGVNPEQISRADLFAWLETELKDIISNGVLPEKNAVVYGHVSMGAAKFLLAKLYLGAEVYTGSARWNDCASVLSDLMDDGYSLHSTSAGKYTPYEELFLADNDRCTDEIIFAVQQDGLYTQSYGSTNYLVFASAGGTMNVNYMGISSGWGGLRTTPEFADKFAAGDSRNLLYDTAKSTADVDGMPETPEERGDSAEKIAKMKEDGTYEDECKSLREAKDAARKDNIQEKSIDDIGNFKYGYGFQKFRNVTSAGEIPNMVYDEDNDTWVNPSFVNTDFPMMRYADVLLMAAECQARGASIDGLSAFNQVRARAGVPAVSSLSLDEILDERARELYQECWRRSDLIRFGKFTSGYNWQWKGEAKDGRDVESYRTLFPIPDSDRLANSNLVQNPGY
ncbi:MAG: RagB/SusD family nutrient uptake outer membrane protein [Bacteroidales bacterium]|nr:RagB/SusD family nutrient uptake outer membrane protein [Bacteroidales bacterium]